MFRPISGAAVWRGHIGVYCAMLVLCVTLAGWGAFALFELVVIGADQVLSAERGLIKRELGDLELGKGPSQGEGRSAPARDTTGKTKGHLTLTQGWTDRILSGEFWDRRGAGSNYGGSSQGNSSRSNLQGPASRPDPSFGRDAATRFHDGEETTYRTVCVRLCDGYFWPISHATTEAYFGRDKATCERGCGGSPAKLYVYQNPGSDLETMRDLEGQPYTRLPSAFQFRTKYEPSCKCTAHPWEQEAKDRHRLYALDAARKKGDKVAAKEADHLKASIEAQRRAQVQAAAQALAAQKLAKKAAAPMPIVSAAIIAANPPVAVVGSPTLESVPAPPTVGPPPGVRPQATQRQAQTVNRASSNSRPAGIQRLGAGSNSSGGSSSSNSRSSSGNSSGASSSRSDSGWQRNAFRGN